MSKITLANVGSFSNDTPAVATVNANSATIQSAFDNTLSRNGASPNQMNTSLDMNNNQILNLPSPGSIYSPARLIDVTTNVNLMIPPVGTSGSVVGLLNGNNTYSGNDTFTGTNTFSGSNTFSGTVTLPAGTAPPVGTSGAVVGLLNGNNTYSGTSTFTGPVILPNGTITNAYRANMPAHTVSANPTNSAGVPQDVQLFPANVVWFGADPTGAADSAAAINAALTASNFIFFPPGTYKVLSRISYTINSASSVTISGSGQDVTVINWPSAAGGFLFNFTSATSGAHLRDFTLTTGVPGGGSAISLSQTLSVGNPGIPATTDISRITLRGSDGYGVTNYWTTGILISNVSGIQMDNITIAGSSAQVGTGISFTGLPSSSTYAVVLDISKSSFFNLGTGFIYGSFIQGVTITQTNFVFVTTSISTIGSETGALVQLAVTDCQFNPGPASGGSAINLQTALGGVQILNNFFVIGGPSQAGVVVAHAAHGQIAFNQIQGIGSSNAFGVIIGPQVSGAPFIVSHNDIYGFGSGGLGIWTQSGSASVLVDGHVFSANTTNTTDSGTGNHYLNNF